MDKLSTIEIKAFIFSFSIATILSIIYAVIVYFSSIPETTFTMAGNLILIMSIFIGSFLITQSHGNKGLIRGLIFGLLFFALLLAFSFLFKSTSIDFRSFFSAFTLCTISGGLGGAIGIAFNTNS